MPKVICASEECKYNADDNTCICDDVYLNDLSITTVYEGRQHLWRCKQYEKSEETKRLEEKFIKLLKEQGLLVFNDGIND